MYKTLFIVLVCSLSLGCAKGEANISKENFASNAITISTITTEYKEYQSLNERPYVVNPRLAMMCRVPSQEILDQAVKQHGPHTFTGLLIKMNDEAIASFNSENKVYAIGSVIVKEKIHNPYNKETEFITKGVGGMVKRSEGYDPEYGDWEYFYFENINDIVSGRIESCRSCHQRAKNKDYVYGISGDMFDLLQ